MTQGGTGLTPAPWMSAAYLNMEERFVRIGEATDSFLSRGGFGDIFLGHDSLTRVNVVIKRQPAATPQAGREHASYNMLQAFRHPNIIRMCGIWTAEYKKQPHLYIAMEACSSDLWRFIRVDNPRSHEHFVPFGGPHKLLLDVVRGVGHLHGLQVAHCDISLSNILITAEGVVKLADFGTVCAHTYLSHDQMAVPYARTPETLLGSRLKGVEVDAYAVSLVALALYTGKVPTSSHNELTDVEDDEFAFLAAARLLPQLTQTTWPDHSTLPHWSRFERLLRSITVYGTLAEFVRENHMPLPQNCLPETTVTLVELGLQWDSQCRSTMDAMERHILGNFVFQVPPGCQPGQGPPEQSIVHPKPKVESHVKDEPQVTPKPKITHDPQHKPTREAAVLAANETKTQQLCKCSGNCGMQRCSQRLNARRSKKDLHICENRVDLPEEVCSSCQCEHETCKTQRQKETKRWCHQCSPLFERADYANSREGKMFDPGESMEWKVVLRLNFLHRFLDPDDNVAFQEVCHEFNPPKVGNLMDPVGVVALVLAHALKWPPVVR